MPGTEILQEIRDTLKKAPALNGGFDRLLFSVENIKEKQAETTEHLKKINESLYDPDEGVHARLKVIEMTGEQQKQVLVNHVAIDAKELEKIAESFEEFKEKQAETDIVLNKLKQTAGVNLENLDAVVKFRNNFDRLYWLLVTGVLTSLGKIFWDLFIKK
jgi:hypothetical protein